MDINQYITSVYNLTCAHFGSIEQAQERAYRALDPNLPEETQAEELEILTQYFDDLEEIYHPSAEEVGLEPIDEAAFLDFERTVAGLPAEVISDTELTAWFHGDAAPNNAVDAEGVDAHTLAFALSKRAKGVLTIAKDLAILGTLIGGMAALPVPPAAAAAISVIDFFGQDYLEKKYGIGIMKSLKSGLNAARS